ncbi:hypothetical protein DXG01_004886 [Tephrocybe rancida]|nr:hypothetical protein DXG01_004886 [Tephrocybe rancida]
MSDAQYPLSNKENVPATSEIPHMRRQSFSCLHHIQSVLLIIREARITSAEFLSTILDENIQEFFDFRTAFYAEAYFERFEQLLDTIWKSEKGSISLKWWLKPHAVHYICDLVSSEMDAAKPHLQMGTADITPEFILTWDINTLMEPIAEKVTPVWAKILEAATETHEAKAKPKTSRSRNRHGGRSMISATVSYLRSFNSCKAQIAMGLVALATGTSREMFNILHASGVSMSYTSISSIVDALTARSISVARGLAASQPVSIAYDNINITTSIFVEQVPGSMNKVQSGTFSMLYRLYNASRDDMLAAPIIQWFQNAKGLTMADVQASSVSREAYQSQTIINVSRRLFTYIDAFGEYQKRPEFQHIPQRTLPDGHKTEYFPLWATTIEEASIEGNILNHDDILRVQLQQSNSDLNTYMIPAINDQLTNARTRGAQALRRKDLTPGSLDQLGSLAHLFSVMEKVWLGAEHPDFHALLSALTQILDGLLLNAWQRECGQPDLDSYAKSNPLSLDILKLAQTIIWKYATPKEDLEQSEKPPATAAPSVPQETKQHSDDGESEESDEESSMSAPPQLSENTPDAVHENVVQLTRDLLVVTELVNAVSVGDFGRIEDLLPDLAYNMLVNVSGLPGHWMGIDLNIEHLIRYLKALFAAKGVYTNWDHLGNLSATIVQLHEIQTHVARSLQTSYQGSMHTKCDPSELVWKVANKAQELQLQDDIPNRYGCAHIKSVPDLRVSGCAKFASSSLLTFNSKLEVLKGGKGVFADEEDTLPALNFSDSVYETSNGDISDE